MSRRSRTTQPTMSFFTMADRPPTSSGGRAPPPEPQVTLSYAPAAPPDLPARPPAFHPLSYTAAAKLLISNTPATSIGLTPSTTIDVAFYLPLGSFIPPLAPLALTSTTTLKNLILELQTMLNKNVRMMPNPIRLLIATIQIRIYDGNGSLAFGVAGKNLPSIEGILQGGLREATGSGCVWVAWNEVDGRGGGRGQKMEGFWMAVQRWLLVDAVSTSTSSASGPSSTIQASDLVFGAEVPKRPMLKVTTVAKVSGLNDRGDVVAGGHLFTPFDGRGSMSSRRMPSRVPLITPEGSFAFENGQDSHGGQGQPATDFEQLHEDPRQELQHSGSRKERERADLEEGQGNCEGFGPAAGSASTFNPPAGSRVFASFSTPQKFAVGVPNPRQRVQHARSPNFTPGNNNNYVAHFSAPTPVSRPQSKTNQHQYQGSYQNQGNCATGSNASFGSASASRTHSRRRQNRSNFAGGSTSPSTSKVARQDQEFSFSSVAGTSLASQLRTFRGRFVSGSAPSSTSVSKRHARSHPHPQSQPQPQQPHSIAIMSASAQSVSEAKLTEAQELLDKLGLTDEAKKLESEILSAVKKKKKKKKKKLTAVDHYALAMADSIPPNQGNVWKQAGGYDKARPFDKERNWGTFQRWGEKPTDEGYKNRQKVHDLLDLSHVPFDGPPVESWDRVQGPTTLLLKEDWVDDREKRKDEMEMQPYKEIDAEELKEALDREREEKPLPEHIKKFWEEQEKIKGLSESDDETHFPDEAFKKNREDSGSTPGKVFAAKELKHSEPSKIDFRNLLYGSTERCKNQGSAYLDSLVAGAAADMYGDLNPGMGAMPVGGMMFSREHAAADNAFKSSLTSFSALANTVVKPKTPAPGFYDMMNKITNHKASKSYGSFLEVMQGAGERDEEGARSEETQMPISSYIEFGNMPGSSHQTAGAYETFNAQASGQYYGAGYGEMGGSFNEMGGGNYQAPTSFGIFNAMASAAPTGYGGLMMPSGHNQQTGYNQSGYGGGNGWTSLGNSNTHPATYNSFGAQSTQYGNLATTNTPMNSNMGRYPAFVPTPTPGSRGKQSRYFNTQGNQQGNPGNYQPAMMGYPINQSHLAPGSYMAGPANLHPAGGSFQYHRVSGTGPSRNPRGAQLGPQLGTNPPSTQRVRRPVPIMPPPGSNLSANSPASKLPSPTRLAIGHGLGGSGSGSGVTSGMGTLTEGTAGVAGPGAGLHMPVWNPQMHFQQFGQSPQATPSSSPTKNDGFGAAFDDALKTAFNGPKNPFAEK